MKSYFVLTLNPAQWKRTTVTICFRLLREKSRPQNYSLNVRTCQKLLLPFPSGILPSSNSSTTLPPVWSLWNTNVSKLLPCLHHFDIHPLLQCFQIEFKLSDMKDSMIWSQTLFTSFIFNYSSSPLPSKLYSLYYKHSKNTCCYKRPFHCVALRIAHTLSFPLRNTPISFLPNEFPFILQDSA